MFEMSQWIHCCPFFSFPVESSSEMADPEEAEKPPGVVGLIQIRLYGFCEKGHYFVKTIRNGGQTASEWSGQICSEPNTRRSGFGINNSETVVHRELRPTLCALGAGGGAVLPTSVTSNGDKVWIVYLQA
jgi:hypothetical protein